MTLRRAGRGLLWRAVLAAWLVVILVVGVTQLAAHVAPLPLPRLDDPLLAAGVASFRPADDDHGWFALHVLFAGCACSSAVLEHLLTRPAGPFAREKVLYLVADAPATEPIQAGALRAAGYELVVELAATLEVRLSLAGVPVLLVADPEGRVRYLGGYSERKQSGPYLDRQIFSALGSGLTPTMLPVFGCPVSARLRRSLDPLGVR